MTYVELHARSAFSFLAGASLPEELAAYASALELPAIALTDRDGVYGAPRFHMAAKKTGVTAHLGSEISFSPRRHGGHGGNQENEITKPPCAPCLRGEPVRLPLLVADRAGYQNLCQLVTKMKLRLPKHPKHGEHCATDYDELAQHARGLICLTGDAAGPLAAALARGGKPEARQELEKLVATFGRGNVYVELQRHFDRAEEARNQVAVELARELGLPLLATNGVAYAAPNEREVLDVLTCVREHSTLDRAGRLLAQNSERCLKPAREMQRLFADLPEAIVNTGELSSRLQFTLAHLGYEFPRYPVPDNDTMDSFLRKRTNEGARLRYLTEGKRHLWPRAHRQLERELVLIEKLELAGYFLIVWDIVRFCRERGILVQGRGSAANSAVCYSLGITAVDPVGMDLLFERFLSEERGEWPDIDLDLPSGEQRERAIQYVYQRYGERGAAMTANVITYRGRSAAREVGKTLGFDVETLDRLARHVSSWEFHDPKDTRARQFRDAGFDLRHPRIRKFYQLMHAVQDLPRHLGQHSGGMVVCQDQLDSVVPLEPAAMPGRVVVQWDKDDCADLGIVKVDLLGLGMMAALEDTIAIIGRDYQEKVDLAQLPPDDRAVYAALSKADTVGMFQIESRAQMSCLPRLQPRNFYDIVVQVAIIRPGPIVGNMVHPYLKRRQGREPVVYPHASLEPVLERTLGVPLFQEQLLRMAMLTAGFSGGQAEELRRAFGFKRAEARMSDVEIKLRGGMTRNGITGAQQDAIVKAITSFALYGFPESHAASFALLAYASAWLKCHYLAAFTAALLNNQPMGFYHPSTLVKDAQRHGLLVKAIDVTRSGWLCTLEEPDSPRRHGVHGENQEKEITKPPCAPCLRGEKVFALRLGLRYVKGLREEAGQALVRERARAPFASIDDLARRVPELRKDELVKLAEVGALNFIGSAGVSPAGARASSPALLSPPATHSSRLAARNFHRRDALWQVESSGRLVGPLLRGIPAPDAPSPLARMTDEERLVADFRGTGLTAGPHPMAFHRQRMIERGVFRAIDLPRFRSGRKLKVAGCVIARQRPGTAKGFVFLSLEDETGIANAIVTPDLYDRYRFELAGERFLLIEGVLQNQDNVISVKAERVEPLRVTEAATSSHDFH